MPAPKPTDASWNKVLPDANPGKTADLYKIDGTPYTQNSPASTATREYPLDARAAKYQIKYVDVETIPDDTTTHANFSVPVTTVMRGGALIIGASALLAWTGTALSGTVIIHPLISIMLMIGSGAFYLMSRLDR